MKRTVIFLGLLCVLAALAAEPRPAQLEVVKKFDAQVFSLAGNTGMKIQGNGWIQYSWPDGHVMWSNRDSGTLAVEGPDGSMVYRLSDGSFHFEFADGRFIDTDPARGQMTWNILAGDKAPDFDLATLDAKRRIRLSDLKGKVVLLDFWASWCGPCRQTLPATQELYRTWAAKGLVVLGVNIEGDPAAAAGMAKKLGLTFDSVLAESSAAGANWKSVQVSQWGVNSIPHVFLLDKKGVVRVSDLALEDTAILESLLAEP